jgi:hypothetical protein
VAFISAGKRCQVANLDFIAFEAKKPALERSYNASPDRQTHLAF